MPTASTIEGNPVFNLGPLTSTWSAPSSCITNGFNTALAHTIDRNEGVFYDSFFDCSFGIWDAMDKCYPDGKEYMSHVEEQRKKAGPTFAAHYFHSPGLECPEGWFTAGAATMNGDGDVEKTGSIFDVYTTIDVDDIYQKPFAQRFADGLDADETGLWCCPSGYTVDPVFEACYSTFDASDVKVTDICDQRVIIEGGSEVTQTFTIDGTAITRSDAITWNGDEIISTESHRTTVEPDFAEDNDLTPVVHYPMITMAYKEGDDDSTGDESNDEGNDNGNEDGNGEENNDGGDGNGDNAAAGLMDAGVMAAVIGAAGALGAALVL